MNKYDLLSELDKLCKDLSDRDKLELLKDLKSELNARIVSLTTSDSGESYNSIFRNILENAVHSKFSGLCHYSRFNKYQALRKSIVDKLSLDTGTSTRMLTKDEYDKCLQYLQEEGYDISTD